MVYAAEFEESILLILMNCSSKKKKLSDPVFIIFVIFSTIFVLRSIVITHALLAE